MERVLRLALVLLASVSILLDGTHFRGGIISWRPLNSTVQGNFTTILLHQRYFWWRNYSGFPRPLCTEANVVAQTPIIVPSAVLNCMKNCASSNFSSAGILANMITSDCDPNPFIESWGGELYTNVTLPLTTDITIGYNSSQWLTTLYAGKSSPWSIVNRLNLAPRPDGYINSSPVTTTLPCILYQRNVSIIHVVQMSDNDYGDYLLCRWSNSNQTYNYDQVDECGGVCSAMPNLTTTLFGPNCTLTFTLPVAKVYYACALQIEDYYTNSSLEPMSSVPIQFLFYAYDIPVGACGTAPSIIGVRPNRACIGVPVGVQLNETVEIQTYCPGQTIIDLVTSSPYGMQHSAISNPSPGLWIMTLTWTPVSDQIGPQGFCAGAIDNSGLQSAPWCITYLVGYESPNLIHPTLVQGSASPIGTVFSNQSLFSIQATSAVGRPTRNGTNICFHLDTTNASVLCYDAGYSPNVIYTGYTIVIVTDITWTPGQSYYVTMDDGFASGSVFCHAESAAITDKTFWRFDIWNPAHSSTTTTTTTPPTTHTVTSLGTTTTSINTACTTSGIVVTTTNASTTTTTVTTTPPTTGGPTTAGPTTTGATTESTIPVFYPKDFENACQQPVAIMSFIMMIGFMPIHTLVMYAAFTKFSNMHKPSNIAAKTRHQQRMKNILGPKKTFTRVSSF
ncbi:unnamed protein product [Adineta steineri]|uniref:Membrane-associated protein n=1 Tax=Adineta steineri TaxID=433720 RepID=A0A818GGF5_9BILA|nr:unnamed protein product [Adineta steineri]CAF3491336.1 unnamed protein product [Adineta steineri]